MSYRTEFGVIDPNGYLASGQAEEYITGYALDERQVAAINEAIADWADRDPEGYSDTEARKLDAQVQGVLHNEPTIGHTPGTIGDSRYEQQPEQSI